MTREQCLMVARLIDETYLEPVCSLRRQEANGKSLAHLRWMITQMHGGMSDSKMMRWLGYVQGILVGVYDVPLDAMKDISRRAVSS